MTFAQSETLRASEASSPVIQYAAGAAKVRAIPLAGHGGEENWSSLSLLPDGRALVGMSSRAASGTLLMVDLDTNAIEPVMNLSPPGRFTDPQRQPKIHVTPVQGHDGAEHFLSHHGLDTHLPLHGSRLGYEGMRWWRWHPTDGGEDRGLVIPGEGAVGLASAERGHLLYVSTFPQSLLLRLHLRTGEIQNLGRTNGVYAPRHIPIGPDQRPYVLDHRGHFWSLDEHGDHLTPTPTELPGIAWVDGDVLAQGFVGLAPARDGGYHATAAWGQLYRMHWDSDLRLLVQPMAMPIQHLAESSSSHRRAGGPAATIAGLAEGPDGSLYLAVSGYNRAVDGSGDSFLLRCRPDGTHTELLARLDGTRIQYIAGCQAVDANRGRILFVGCHMTADHPYLFVIDTSPAKKGAS